MKKVIAVLLAVMLMVGVLVGCGGSGAGESTGGDPTGKTIAVCMGTMNHPVHRIIQMAFLTEGKAMGYKAIVGGLDEGGTSELLAKFESIIANGAEGCLMWASDTAYYQFMRDMRQQGLSYFVVPHFAHEYNDTRDFISRNICCQASAYGYEAGQFIIERLAEKGITSGTLAVSQAGPNVTENAAADAFRLAIKESGTSFVVREGFTAEGLEVSAAATKLSSVITATSDLVGAFGTTGGSAQAWDVAMTQTGKTGLVIVGVDYTEKNLELVESGTITGIVAQPLYDEAKASVQTLDAIFRAGNDEQFTSSSDSWWLKMDAPIVSLNGVEEDEKIEYYDPIIQQVIDYYGN